MTKRHLSSWWVLVLVALCTHFVRPSSAQRSLGEKEFTVLNVEFDLDVNADGDVDDSVDRVTGYLPGYEGSSAKIQWNANGQYVSPQEMKLVAKWDPTVAPFDEVVFLITKRTFILGFCMNSTLDPGADDDYSFAASGDDLGPKTGSLSTGKATLPFYCKDFGGYCEVKVQCKKGGDLICEKTLKIPKDDNSNEIADAWYLDNYSGSDPLWDEETTAGVPSNGDGLTRFEEYRGFLRKNRHARMSPVLKELFVYRENETYNVGDGPPTLAWIEYVTADEMNGAKYDNVNGTRTSSKGPRIVNFFNKASAHKVDQHGLWIAVLDAGNDGNHGNWGLCKDNMGGAALPIGPPETAGRVEIYAQNIRDCCGPVAGTNFDWDASSRAVGLIGDIASHEAGHGLSMEHPGNLADLVVTNYPTNLEGNGKGSFNLSRENEGGGASAYMRYRFSEVYAAIAGDLDRDGNPNEPGESPDKDWTPTLTDATEYAAAGLLQTVIDDSDE